MPSSFTWQPGPSGGTPMSADNLNKLAVVADVATAGTPTGDALRAAYGTVVSVKSTGAKGDGTTDDTAVIQALLNSITSNTTVVFPQGTYLVGNLQLVNKTNFRLVGQGATLQMTGDGSTGNGVGIELVGTIANVEITGFHIIGDGVKAHKHAGVWNNSGQTISDLSIHHNVIEQVRVGISVNANTSGSIDGFEVTHNVIKDLVGIASGEGYGIHAAQIGAASVRGLIGYNRIYRAGRHSIYCARVSDLDIVGNRIYGHRSAITTAEQADATNGRGKTRPAINIARSHNIRATGNWFMDGYDCAIAIVPNPEGDVGVVLYDVALENNHFLRPQDSIPMLIVGDPSPSIAGIPTDILVQGNDFYADFSTLSGVNSIEAVRVNDGMNVKVKNNHVVIRGVNVTTAGIGVRAQQDGSGTNTYTNDVEVSGNAIHLATGNGSTCRGVAADTTLATSIASASLIRNEASGDAANVPTYTPAFTNPNLRVGTRTGDVVAVTADGDTSPSVARGVTLLDVTNSATTSITNLTNGEDGQTVTLRFADLNTRLVYGTNLRVAGAVNYVSGNRQTITLVNRAGVWYEVARSSALPYPVIPWAANAAFGPLGLSRLPTGGLGYSTNGLTAGTAFDATERARWQFTPGGHIEVLPSGTTTWVCPGGISEATFDLFGAGGGGGGGGSASAVSTQVGGGGGGAGENARVMVAVTPGTTYTVAIGAAGAAGTGAASGGAAGTAGGSGGDTTVLVSGTTYIARGGTGGGLGAANSTTTVGGGVPGRNAGLTTTTATIPGCGGPATSTSGTGATPLDSMIGGGAGAPAASTTLAGLGGAARTTIGARVDSVTGNTGTTTAGAGTAATLPGCGGGGGGGGAVGGAGGNGGAGAAGQIIVRF